MEKYKPISCDFHSLLEDAAVRKKKVSFLLMSEVIVIGVIEDLYTLKGEEFMLLGSGEKIRLDEIIKMDNFRISDFSCGF